MATPQERSAKLLIVEDEMLVAVLIEDALAEMGITPLGPVPTVAGALQMIAHEAPVGALLDVNLRGELIYPVAEALAARQIPFAFITGYGARGIRQEFADRPILQKPFTSESIKDVIRKLRPEAG